MTSWRRPVCDKRPDDVAAVQPLSGLPGLAFGYCWLDGGTSLFSRM
jgi:hypothetical protein